MSNKLILSPDQIDALASGESVFTSLSNGTDVTVSAQERNFIAIRKDDGATFLLLDNHQEYGSFNGRYKVLYGGKNGVNDDEVGQILCRGNFSADLCHIIEVPA